MRLLADGGEVPAPYVEKGPGRSERGASCKSRNDLVGIVSPAEADALAQRPTGVLIFGDEDPAGNQAAEIFSVNMRKGGGSAAFVPLPDGCGDPAGAARAFAEREAWTEGLGAGRSTSMAPGNGQAAGFPSAPAEGGLSLYALANKRAESRNEDGLARFRTEALKQSGAVGRRPLGKR